MIIDSFLFNDEKELLELRLKVLYDYVDKFVIVECDHTFNGESKNLTCKKILKELGFENEVRLMMGIGFKDETKNRRTHHLTGKMMGRRVKEPIEVEYHK